MYYRIKAVTSDNTSEYSDILSLYHLLPPTSLKATMISSDSIAIAWKNHASKATIVSLDIRKYDDNDNGSFGFPSKDFNTTVTQYTHQTIEESTLYRYNIAAATANWKHAIYSWNSLMVWSLLKAPSDLVVSAKEENRLKLSWINNTQTEKYSVVIEMAEEEDFVEVATVDGSASEYWVENIDTQATQQFRIKIINDNTTSAYSNVLSSADFITGISDEVAQDIKIALFPNPTGNSIHLDSQTAIERLEITDLRGSKIKQLVMNGNHTYDISSLQPGVYLLSAWSDEGVHELNL